MTRIDMSEYQERHSVSRLVGSPPGYVGYEEGGQLTEAVRRKPYSVVLLDEIEKAHPDVFNILLQVLDDGRLTDNKGRVVNFKNTIIIMTSNMGSQMIQDAYEKNSAEGLDFDSEEQLKSDVLALLRKTLRPEFLYRIDETIMFRPLSKKDIVSIVDIQLNMLAKRLLERGIKLKASEDAKAYLAEVGYDPAFGARPVKRVIQKEVLNELSKQLLAGNIDAANNVVLDVFEGKIVFRKPINKKEMAV
jgi:ATP-dependent Clp protease ATP-binding subunit ClpB